MKTFVIQLNQHDDAISIRDKMSWAKTSRIILVWPENYLKLQHLDLILVQRAGLTLGAQIALVVDQEEIALIAKELGILVFSSLSQAQKSSWRRRRKKAKIIPQKPKLSTLPLRQPAASFHENPPMRLLRFVIFGFGCLAVLVLIGFLLPTAKVTIYPNRTIQSLDVEVRASPKLIATSLIGGLPIDLRTVMVEAQDNQKSTGSVRVPVKSAIGTVVFTNLTNEPLLIPTGQIVATSETPNIRFQLMSSVSLEGKINSTIEGRIQALQPGESGNILPKRIRVIEGGLGIKVSVNNPESTIGGADQVSASPSIQDQDELRQKVMKQLGVIAINEFANTSGLDYLIPPSVILKRIVSEQFEPGIGLPSDNLRIIIQAEYQGWFVQMKDLKELGQLSLDISLPSNHRGIPATIQISPQTEVSLEGDYAQWQFHFERQIEEKINSEWIKTILLGRTVSEAQSLAEGFVISRQSPKIQLNPGWWLWMPLLGFQIEVIEQ